MSFSRYRDWLDEALDDLSVAEILFREGKYSKVCFFAQQAAEKALRALIIYRHKRYVDIHSISELLRIAKAPQELIEKGDTLDRHYIPSRYPNAWPYGAPYKHYKKSDAEEALRICREVISYVLREIKESS